MELNNETPITYPSPIAGRFTDGFVHGEHGHGGTLAA